MSKERYTINLSLQDYVKLTGVYLANVRDELANFGDEENEHKVKEAIKLIDNNLVIVKEVSNG